MSTKKQHQLHNDALSLQEILNEFEQAIIWKLWEFRVKPDVGQP